MDEAGNIGPETSPAEIRVDGKGPVLTVTQATGLLQGTASDGSGVASVEVSLDGGTHYQPAAVTGENWSFDTASWSGTSKQPFAMLRAGDVRGNVTREVTVWEARVPDFKVYLPIILRRDGR